MPRLYVLSGPDLGKHFDLADGALVGRAPECQAQIRDASVSRQHARLELLAGAWRLVDQGSRNGLYVDGLRSSAITLADGLELRVGEVLLRVRIDAAEPVPASQPAPEHDEIVLEGDFKETTYTPAKRAFPPSNSPSHAPSNTPSAAPAAPVPDAGLKARAELLRSTKPAAASKGILQYNRVADRAGLANSDLSQQPLWLRLAAYLVALALFAAVGWFALHATTFFKAKTASSASENAPDEPR